MQCSKIHFACKYTDTAAKMLLFEELPGFLTVLLNLHMRFDSVYVQKEAVNFISQNPLGDCPGSLNGGMRSPSKCLVVVQEWWGMNEQIKEQARHIAELGKFVTLVPDLYRGKVARNFTEALHLTRGLDYPGEIRNMQPLTLGLSLTFICSPDENGRLPSWDFSCLFVE